MKLRLIFYILAIVILGGAAAFSQSTTTISRRCPGATPVVARALVDIEKDGDIQITPCNGRLINIGTTPSSGLVTTATGTANFIPRYTAAAALAKTPFSWDGTNYSFQNTALTSEFGLFVKPDTATGTATMGDITGTAKQYFSIGSGTSDVQAYAQSDATHFAGADFALSGFTNLYSSGGTAIYTDTGTIDFSSWSNATQWKLSFKPDKTATNVGLFTVGDCVTTPTTCFTMDQAAGTFSMNAGTGTPAFSADSTSLVLGNALDTSVQINQSSNTFTFGQAGNVGTFALSNINNYQLQRTITTAGTTGARTINQPAGTVNVAAGQSSIVVTNNTVTTSSIVFPVLRTADTTCTFVKSAVPTANTITITLNAACNAETSVGFLVTN